MRNDPFDPFGQEMPDKKRTVRNDPFQAETPDRMKGMNFVPGTPERMKRTSRRPAALVLILLVLAVASVLAGLTIAGSRRTQPDTGMATQAGSTTRTAGSTARPENAVTRQENTATRPDTGSLPSQQQTDAAEEYQISRIPHFEDRFYLRNMSQELQRDTAAIYQGIASFEKEIELPDKTDSGSVERIMAALRYDCPELFQVSFESSFQLKTYNDIVHSVMPAYGMEKEEYDRKLAECREVITQLVRDTKESAGQSPEAGTGSGSQEAAERYLYDTLTDWITYSTDASGCGNACGALIGREAKCDGISLAMKWAMEEIGIPALVIAGRDKGDPNGHAWNCVQIDGVWHDLDLTNDSGAPERIMKLYPAFNVAREWMTRMYPPDPVIASSYDLPASETMDHSYHVLNGSFVPAGNDARNAFFALLDAAASGSGGESSGDEEPGTGTGRIQFEDDADFSAFMENCNTYVTEWFNERHRGGGFNIITISGFRTCGFILTVN